MPTRELHHLCTIHYLALEDTASPNGLVLIFTGSIVPRHVVGVQGKGVVGVGSAAMRPLQLVEGSLERAGLSILE